MLSESSLVLVAVFVAFGPQQGKTEAAQAAYKDSGAETHVQNYVDTYPKDLRLIVGDSAIIVNGIVHQYLSYTWTF